MYSCFALLDALGADASRSGAWTCEEEAESLSRLVVNSIDPYVLNDHDLPVREFRCEEALGLYDLDQMSFRTDRGRSGIRLT